MAHESKSCDIEVHHDTHPLVRIESKFKASVDGDDVHKFRRDLYHTSSHGILVSARCSIVGRRRGAVFEKLDNGKFAAYLCAHRQDQHADNDLDVEAIVSAIRVLHMLDDASSELQKANAHSGIEGHKIISPECLDKIGQKMDEWSKKFREIKDHHTLILDQADRMKSSATKASNAIKDIELNYIKSMIFGDQVNCSGLEGGGNAGPSAIVDAPLKTSHTCQWCKKTLATKANHDRHAATCKNKPAADESLDVQSMSTESKPSRDTGETHEQHR